MIKKLIMFIIIVALIVGIAVLWYTSSIKAVDKNSTEKISIEIPIGSSADDIANVLENNGLIKNKLAFKLYVKLNKVSDFNAGKYELYKNMDVEELTKILKTGILYKQVKIVFIEGETIKTYAKEIEKATNNTQKDVFELLKDEEYIDSLIEKYWFLTDEIKNEDIYYPLEGYLFPDTYFFESKDITVKEIFEELLNQTDKVLSEYKNEFEESKYTIHQLMSLGSIIENEVTNSETRKNVSGVLYNRLNKDMALECDASTYYAFQIEKGNYEELNKKLYVANPYNTRGPGMRGKMPVGPISSVSKESIEAALNPIETEYLFYVTDIDGKIYYSKTNEEHEKIISNLKQQGLWYE